MYDELPTPPKVSFSRRGKRSRFLKSDHVLYLVDYALIHYLMYDSKVYDIGFVCGKDLEALHEKLGCAQKNIMICREREELTRKARERTFAQFAHEKTSIKGNAKDNKHHIGEKFNGK
jgi:hypothetical protein